jgi:hypothetical protein
MRSAQAGNAAGFNLSTGPAFDPITQETKATDSEQETDPLEFWSERSAVFDDGVRGIFREIDDIHEGLGDDAIAANGAEEGSGNLDDAFAGFAFLGGVVDGQFVGAAAAASTGFTTLDFAFYGDPLGGEQRGAFFVFLALQEEDDTHDDSNNGVNYRLHRSGPIPEKPITQRILTLSHELQKWPLPRRKEL